MKKTFILLCFLFLSLCFISFAKVLNYSVSPSTNVYLDGKKLKLDTPLIIFKNNTLLPLRDLSKAIDARMIHKRITDEYLLVGKDYRFVFSLNDNLVEFNNGVIKMPVMAPWLYSQLYIPLVFIMDKLSYKLKSKYPHYHFTKIKAQPSKLKNNDPKKEEETLPDDLNLDETTPISKNIEKQATKAIEKKEAKTLKLDPTLTSPLFITTGKKNKYINNTNRPKGKCHIYQVSYRHQENKLPQVEILTTKKANPVINILPKPRRLVVDFKKTVIDTPKKKLIPQKTAVKNIRLGQFTKDKARVVIETNQHYILKTLKDRVIIKLTKNKKTTKPKKQKKYSSAVLKNKKIAIIAGHGGVDPGAVGQRKTLEKDVTLDTAYKLRKLLINAGAKVVMVRDKDKFMSLRQRVAVTNRNRPDIAISIHYNSSKWKHLLGIETYYYKSIDYRLAKCVHGQMLTKLKRPNRKIRRARFYELNHTKMPCVLVEPAYMSNYWEEMLIRNKSFREKVAYAIFNGIKQYFNK